MNWMTILKLLKSQTYLLLIKVIYFYVRLKFILAMKYAMYTPGLLQSTKSRGSILLLPAWPLFQKRIRF